LLAAKNPSVPPSVVGSSVKRLLDREWSGSRSGECDRERGEHREVSVKLNATEVTGAQRLQTIVVLQAAETPLDCAPASVEVAEPLALARDEWLQSRRLAPHACGLALASRAAPLRRVPFEVGSGERPLAVLADGWPVRATLTA
jgi:hypothetical protein